MNNRDWFECCWDEEDKGRWIEPDARRDEGPTIHQYFAGHVYVPGYGEWQYEGYERDWNPTPGEEALEGTVYIVQATKRNWTAIGNSLQEAERNLITTIQLSMETFVNRQK